MQQAFIGNYHGRGEADRKSAVETFTPWEPHYQNNTLKHHEMGAIYNNSVFVVVGRGWITLDCFRIYESIISGAIPLIVGSKNEIDKLFHYNGNDMPLLTAESWKQMLQICQGMNDTEIDSRRTALVTWYVSKIHHIRDLIDATFNITILPDAVQ